MKKTSLMALVLGICLLVGGFVYDVLYAGIPYQDPTPEMQARYDQHTAIATKLMQVGLVVAIVGGAGFTVFRYRSNHREPGS